MRPLVTVEEAIERLAQRPDPPLVAVDGLPCSGKSTLADALVARHGYNCLALDDFVRPEDEWRLRARPAFPFEYIRYDEFVHTVRTLASTGECAYAPFDWETLTVSRQLRSVTLATPVIVDGVSSLHPTLSPMYGLRLFLASDRATVLETADKRGAGMWSGYWRTLFLPSADRYMDTRPEERADLIVVGRGVIV